MCMVCMCAGSPGTSEHPARRCWGASSAADTTAVLAPPVTAAGAEGEQLQSLTTGRAQTSVDVFGVSDLLS